MKTIAFDPRCLIMPPFRKCPACHTEGSLGVISVHSSSYTRRCKECSYDLTLPLPKIEKKVIYLDQFAISNMTKVLDPNWDSSGLNPLWLELFQKLDVCSKMQLIICPDSITHLEESIVYSDFKKIKRVYEHLSNGITFMDFDAMLRWYAQVYAEDWVNCEPKRELLIRKSSVFHGQINAWQDRFKISIDTKITDELIASLKEDARYYEEEFNRLIKHWSEMKSYKFDEQVKRELYQNGEAIVEKYLSGMEQIRRYANGEYNIDLTPILMGKNNILVNTIVDRLIQIGLNMEEAQKKSLAFFFSDSFYNIPIIKLQALIWASIAKRYAVGGQKRKADGSIANDIRTISGILPYCDAIFVDIECAQLLKEIEKYHEYTTKVFTVKTIEEFILYLDKIINSANEEHIALINDVYGESYFMPFDSILKN